MGEERERPNKERIIVYPHCTSNVTVLTFGNTLPYSTVFYHHASVQATLKTDRQNKKGK